ncbi:MAG: toll/interleukin-1 receptor domain-containing protein [Candidatus Thiodiazotropha sp. (ex Clathrolucina costata)]|nr:toll/interleukin-1 receptor domain-containing protein [Candidatus Thiodiazotropha taylori]
MTDIFISYKREDRKRAHAIAEMFVSHGYDVWWDIELLPGQKFADEINSVISKAKAVVVLWTPKSVLSDWVKAEAAIAFDRSILIPAWLEKVTIPAPYNTGFARNLRTHQKRLRTYFISVGRSPPLGAPKLSVSHNKKRIKK